MTRNKVKNLIISVIGKEYGLHCPIEALTTSKSKKAQDRAMTKFTRERVAELLGPEALYLAADTDEVSLQLDGTILCSEVVTRRLAFRRACLFLSPTQQWKRLFISWPSIPSTRRWLQLL